MITARYRLNTTKYVLKWQKKHQKVPKFNKITLSTLSTPPLWLIHFFKINNIHIRAIPFQRSKKEGQRWKVDFVWWNVKDNKANLWFWPFFNNFCNFGVFFPKMKNTQKLMFEKKVLFKDWNTYFKYHIYHSYSIDFLFC